MPAEPILLRDLVITPFRAGAFSTQIYRATAAKGPVAALGPLLISSRAHRAIRWPGTPAAKAEIPGPAIWGGVFYAHFGHFITEFLPRLLTLQSLARRFPDAPILTIPQPDAPTLAPDAPALPAHAHWFLSQLGIDPARIVQCTEPCRIGQLLVPQTPFAARARYHPDLIPLIDAAPWANAPATGERLFLSRRHLDSTRSRVTNIAEVEAAYIRAGYRVLYPETLSLPDQIAQICGATAIAGENGSALHWALYSRHLRHVHALGWTLNLQKGIAILRGQTYQPLRAPLTGWMKGRQQSVPIAVVRRALSAK